VCYLSGFSNFLRSSTREPTTVDWRKGGNLAAAIQLCNADEGEKWYLVRTKQQKEALVQYKLGGSLCHTFLPRIRTKRLRDGTFIESVTPLFPCYLFARFELETTLYKVLHTIGVAGIVCAGSTPSEVDPLIIDEISRRGHDGVIEIPPKALSAGERVRLTDGPLKGFAGIFEHYRSGSRRVALLLNVVGASMKVVVPASSVAGVSVD
jgi:transcriptional antiterminator RfaH